MPGIKKSWGKVLSVLVPAILIVFLIINFSSPARQLPDSGLGTNAVEQASAGVLSNAGNLSDDGLKVHFIDVGQADSVLIQAGTHAMLIDAGNHDDVGLIKRYLEQQGIKELEYVVGTHPHEDHIGGLDGIISSYPVREVIMPKVTATTTTFKDVAAAVQKKGLKITTPVPNNKIMLGDAECVIYAPNSGEYQELNNYSVVIRVKYGSTAFLFTGDAEGISEEEMINKGYELSADVLKVGHHGSASSTTSAFLKKVHPQYAVISVGKDNSFRHPSQQTIDRLLKNNIQIYRTDLQGNILAVSDGETIHFSLQRK